MSDTETMVLEQAALLMQPALIRVIDQIRKRLEQSDWSGTYETQEIWPEGTSADMQSTVMQLQQQLAEASPDQELEITETLAQLPQPQIEYQLHLKKQGHQVDINLWQVCCQVCFCNDILSHREAFNLATLQTQDIAIDTSLLEASGEVDWHRLDAKAHDVVAQVFQALPSM